MPTTGGGTLNNAHNWRRDTEQCPQLEEGHWTMPTTGGGTLNNAHNWRRDTEWEYNSNVMLKEIHTCMTMSRVGSSYAGCFVVIRL